MNIEVFIILILTSLACVSVGVFLLLRKLSMMTDAISHTILLGIVLGFLFSHSIQSPLFIIFGGIVGVLSAWMISALKNTGKVNEDAAIGLVFPLLFGIAVILLTIFAKNVHLDLDAVLLGEVIFAPLSRVTIFSISIATAVMWISLSLLLNTLFIFFCYKELKVSSFDAMYAKISGFSLGIIQYSLMTLVSFTSVVAFDAVGSVLVIALMIGPAITGRLLTDSLGKLIGISVLVALCNCTIGYILSIYFDVSVAGMIAAVTGVIFLITALIAPQKGIITRILKKRNNKGKFEKELLLLHLKTHEHTPNYKIEAGKETILQHLHWTASHFSLISKQLIRDDEIKQKDGVYYLTEKGEAHVAYIASFYGLPRLSIKESA